MEENWMYDAACRDADPETFFPDLGHNGREAKKICARCTVVHECLEYALLDNITDGIWGGMSGDQRHKIRRKYMEARA